MRAAKSSSFEDQEVLTGKESKLVDELEPCFSRFADYLRARNELLGRVGRMVAAGWIIDDRQPAVLLQPGEHPAIEIRPVGDVVGRVAKEYEVDGVAGQQRIVFPGDDAHDVAKSLLLGLLLEISQDVRCHVD